MTSITALLQQQSLDEATNCNGNDSTLPIPRPPSAARTAFETVDVRGSILDNLDEADLVTFMRVSKASMPDVARMMLLGVSYEEAQSITSENPEREALYRGLVRQVDCREFEPSLETWQAMKLAGIDPSLGRVSEDQTPSGRAFYFSKYSPEVCHFFASSLKSTFPSLRMIAFGGGNPGMHIDTWVFEFTSPNPTSFFEDLPSPTPSPSVTGHVDLIQTRIFFSDKEPPAALISPSAPSIHCTIRERFNMSMHSGEDDKPLLLDRWVAALRNNRGFGEMYTHFGVSGVSLPLDVFTSIYRHQIECGNEERLEHITSWDVVSWSFDDMREFAKIASSSLVSLCLSDSSYDNCKSREGTVGMTFADLPAFVALVRTYLTSLCELQILIRGIETAEATCGGFLHPGILDEGGLITSCVIVTPPCSTPLFNVIRVLSQMCTAEADVSLADEFQYGCLPYLRAQSPARKKHLSIVDFASIGVTSFADFDYLCYSDDENPLMLSRDAAADLCDGDGDEGREGQTEVEEEDDDVDDGI